MRRKKRSIKNDPVISCYQSKARIPLANKNLLLVINLNGKHFALKKVFNVNRIYTSLIIQTIPGEKKEIQHIQLDSIWSNEGYFVNTIREIYSSAFTLQQNIVWHDTNILYIEFTVLCWFIWWKNRKNINVFAVKYVEGNWKWKTNPITVLVRRKSHMWIDDDWLLMLFLILVYDVKMLCVCVNIITIKQNFLFTLWIWKAKAFE